MRVKCFFMMVLMVGISSYLFAQDAAFYKKYADKGDKEALYNLANCYLNGNGGVQQDYNQATMLLTKAAKKNYAPAQVSLAYCYLYGAGVMKDYDKAWDLVQKAAKQNNAGAHYLMSQMYKDGIHVSPNNVGYLKYLQSASDLGDDDAQVELGKLYLWGNKDYNISQDERKAVSLFQRAAEQNNGDALLQLGFCYKEGTGGLPKDIKRAFEYTYQSAQTGFPNGIFETGLDYIYGIGTDVNYNEAARYISAAAQHEVPNAYKLMGDIYYYGLGVEANDVDASQWYQKAVDSGYGNAYSQLAWMYYVGRGVPENEPKAYQLYKEAADAGYAEGYAGLGMCYENGAGVTKNIYSATSNYKKAADLGNNYAQYSLYRIYRKGEGVTQDNQQALQYLRQAADDEYNDAMYSLGYEYLIGEILHQENSKAIEWMTKSADNGYSFGAAVLGTFYYTGNELVEKDYNKAFLYLLEAAKNPNSINENLLAEVYKDLGACYRFGRGTEVNHSLASYYTEQAASLGDTSSFDAVKMLRNN